MARTVVDAAAMLSVIAGRDEHDSKTANIPFAAIPDYRAASMAPLPPPGKLRLGIPRNALADVELPVLEAFEGLVVTPLRAQQGVVIVDCVFAGLDRFEALPTAGYMSYMAGEFHDALPAYLAGLVKNPQHIDSLEALCAFTKETAGEEYGESEQQLEQLGISSTGPLKAADSPLPSPRPSSPVERPPQRNIATFEQSLNTARDCPEFLAARKLAKYFAGPGGIQGALDGLSESGGHGPVDALLLPTDAGSANYFAACEGHPQVTVPLGYHTADVLIKNSATNRLVTTGPNVPFGVSVIGHKFGETALLSICTAIEELTHTRDGDETRRLSRFQN